MLLLGLAGCGFQPLYGPRADGAPAVQAELETIQIRPIAERVGQRLYNVLRDRLNPRGTPAAPRYVLSVALTETEEKLALASDKTPTRTNVTLVADYSLTPIEAAEPVYRGRSRTTISYNILTESYATYAAAEDARVRGARVLGDDIRTRLALYLSGATAGRAPAPPAP